MSKIIGFIVTAGHLDIEWYQPLRSYRFWTTEALEDLKTIHHTREDFVTYCLDGQLYPLKEHLTIVPEDEEEMREMIRKNMLTIGPFYTQFDEWLPSAESMIRNCLYGDRLCKSFGGYMRAGYLPDNFGHPLQMPQILKNFDIDSLLFMRGMPEIPGGHDDEFLYTGIDGSEIFVSHFRESYSGAFDIFRKNVLKYMSPWGEEQEELLALSPTTGRHQTVEMWLPVNLLTPGKCELLSSHAPTVDIPRKEIAIVDENGRRLPTQVIERSPIPVNGNGDPRHEMYPASVFEKVLFSDDFTAF